VPGFLTVLLEVWPLLSKIGFLRPELLDLRIAVFDVGDVLHAGGPSSCCPP
jgi:hypothetical protein